MQKKEAPEEKISPPKKPKGWILYRKPFSEITPEAHEINRLLQEAKNMDIDLEVVCPQEFELLITKSGKKSIRLKNEEVTLPDFLLPRMGSGTTYFALAVIRQLEKLGVICLNGSQGIEESKDKLYSHQILASSRLPVPKTMLSKFPIDPKLVEANLGFPVVVKSISGSQGKGVFLAKDPETFNDFIGIIETANPSANFIFQEYIEESRGSDIRVIVIGGVPVAAMKRTSKDGGFKANYSQGGIVERIPLTQEMQWLATEATHALHLDISGIDLLESKEGLKICEVNSSPGFQGMESCLLGKEKANIARTILEFIQVRLG